MEALIVSNDESVRKCISEELAARQVKVQTAGSTRQALEIISKTKPWLIFAEILGEEVSALSILRAVERDRPEISVVGLTKSFDAQEALALLRRGMRDYISVAAKDELNKLVRKAVHRARVRANGIVSYMSEHDLLEQEKDTISHELLQLQQDQEAGRFVQLKLFPKNFLRLGGFEFSHRIFPSLYLSGDFFDYFPLDENRSFFYFADVSGHGASSAFITMMLKTLCHRWVIDAKKRGEVSPSEFISHVNQEMSEVQLGKHMTLFSGVIDEPCNLLRYSLAAHFPKPRLRNASKMFSIEESGLPVGLFEDAEYEEWEITMEDDFALFLFSDGIMEVIEAENLESKENLLALAIDAADLKLSTLCDRFDLESRDNLPDDIGILLIKRCESPGTDA
jgi:serine phosphatase RsbU (regulator of sigma subunit)